MIFIKRNEPLRWKFTNAPFIEPKRRRESFGRLRDLVNGKQTPNFWQTETKTFYRKFNQFIWKFVWKFTSRKESSLGCVVLKKMRTLREQNWTLCVHQLVSFIAIPSIIRTPYHCYFVSHKFHELPQRKKTRAWQKELSFLQLHLQHRLQRQNKLDVRASQSILHENNLKAIWRLYWVRWRVSRHFSLEALLNRFK